jgi:hypothetical protein
MEEPSKGIQHIADKLSGWHKWQGRVVDRERIQGLLRQVREKVAGDLDSITDHTEYRMRQQGKLLRDVVWAFSKAGKRELIRRRRLSLPSRE